MKSLFQTIDNPPASAGLLKENPLLLMWAQRQWFVAVFAGVLLAVVAALLLLPSRYFTSGSLIVAERESGLSLPPPGWAQKVGDPADIESQLLVIRSNRLMRMVLEKPGVIETIRAECNQARNPVSMLMGGARCDDLTPDSPAAIDYLQSRYAVGGAGRSRVITIGYTSSQPTTAQTMANTLINTFLQDHREGISDGRAVAMAGLGEEIERLDREIRSDDAKIQTFRGAKGLTNGAQAPITSERLSSINTQLALAETSRSQAAAIIAAARDGGNNTTVTLPAVLESRTVADVKQRLSAAQEQLAAGAISLGPRHPRLQAMQSQVGALQADLQREVANVVASARKQFDAAERTVASLKKELETAKVEASTASRDETSIEQMVRDLGVKRAQYASLFDQRKKLESEQKALLGSTRLVSLAELPEKRFFPKTTPFLAGGFVLALIAGSAAALLRGRMKTPPAADDEEPAKPEQARLVARLPLIRKHNARATGMLQTLIDADDDAGMQLALGEILSRVQGNSRSLVVLSAFEGEGKTFTTLALARAAANAGKRVLLVEADMRRPALAELFRIRPSSTLADVLSGHVPPHRAVISTDMRRLDVIIAGDPESVSPTELLMNDHLMEFLTWAETYDLVLIDGPALDRQMDAGILACRADGFLFCTNSNEGQLAEMADITRRLTNLGAQAIGFVLTPQVENPVRQDFGQTDKQRMAAGGR